MAYSGKIITKRTKRFIDKMFYNLNAIKKAIAVAEYEKEDTGGRTGDVGYSPPDPTGNKAAHNLSEIPSVTVTTKRGEKFTVHRPQKWVTVLDDCLKHYEGDFTGKLVRRRYFKHQRPEATCSFLAIGESMYYERVDSFLNDVAIIAIKVGLIKGEWE